jgi:hypothetical protein
VKRRAVGLGILPGSSSAAIAVPLIHHAGEAATPPASVVGISVWLREFSGSGCRGAAGGANGLAGQSVRGEARAAGGAGRRREPFSAVAGRYPSVAVGTHTVPRIRSPFLHLVQVYEYLDAGRVARLADGEGALHAGLFVARY